MQLWSESCYLLDRVQVLRTWSTHWRRSNRAVQWHQRLVDQDLHETKHFLAFLNISSRPLAMGEFWGFWRTYLAILNNLRNSKRWKLSKLETYCLEYCTLQVFVIFVFLQVSKCAYRRFGFNKVLRGGTPKLHTGCRDPLSDLARNGRDQMLGSSHFITP